MNFENVKKTIDLIKELNTDNSQEVLELFNKLNTKEQFLVFGELLSYDTKNPAKFVEYQFLFRRA